MRRDDGTIPDHGSAWAGATRPVNPAGTGDRTGFGGKQGEAACEKAKNEQGVLHVSAPACSSAKLTHSIASVGACLTHPDVLLTVFDRQDSGSRVGLTRAKFRTPDGRCLARPAAEDPREGAGLGIAQGVGHLIQGIRDLLRFSGERFGRSPPGRPPSGRRDRGSRPERASPRPSMRTRYPARGDWARLERHGAVGGARGPAFYRAVSPFSRISRAVRRRSIPWRRVDRLSPRSTAIAHRLRLLVKATRTASSCSSCVKRVRPWRPRADLPGRSARKGLGLPQNGS